MRSQLLVRHFLTRFLEHDLVSPNADRREVLSVAGGTLIALSLFVSALIALQYQFANFLPPGITAARSLNERFLFVSASMFVMALLAVALWDGLALDARDAAVLGLLPVPRSAIVRAKFTAVALVAAGTDVAWNVAPTLFRGASLPMTLTVGFKGAIILMLAQGATTLAAGAFGFLGVLALREGLAALLGQNGFRAISSALQAALVVALASALLLLPGRYSQALRWLAKGGIAARLFPPFWFVGLHETVAGSIIDGLPRTTPQPFLIDAERNATRLYRSLWPLYPELARIAIVALPVVAILAVVACAWNGRRLPVPPARRRRDAVQRHRVWRRAITCVVARASLQQAGFWFTLQTLPRRVTHRAVLASAIAVGLSLMAVTVRDLALTAQANISSVPLAVLAAQSLLLAALVTGFRHAVQLPAELRASSTFSVAWSGHLQPYVSGVKRAGWLALVLPTLLILFVWHSAILGVPMAAMHLATGVGCSIVLMELLFLGYRRLPLVSGYIPSTDLKSRGPAYVIAIFFASYILAWIERAALETSPLSVAALLGALLLIAVALSVGERSRQPPVSILDLDEEIPLPTQRLNLAG